MQYRPQPVCRARVTGNESGRAARCGSPTSLRSQEWLVIERGLRSSNAESGSSGSDFSNAESGLRDPWGPLGAPHLHLGEPCVEFQVGD